MMHNLTHNNQSQRNLFRNHCLSPGIRRTFYAICKLTVKALNLFKRNIGVIGSLRYDLFKLRTINHELIALR